MITGRTEHHCQCFTLIFRKGIRMKKVFFLLLSQEEYEMPLDPWAS